MDALWLHIVQWLHTVGLHVDAGTARDVAGGMAQVTQKLDMPSLLALAAALGWASGFRLYAVVFIVGVMGAGAHVKQAHDSPRISVIPSAACTPSA